MLFYEEKIICKNRFICRKGISYNAMTYYSFSFVKFLLYYLNKLVSKKSYHDFLINIYQLFLLKINKSFRLKDVKMNRIELNWFDRVQITKYYTQTNDATVYVHELYLFPFTGSPCISERNNENMYFKTTIPFIVGNWLFLRSISYFYLLF